MNNIISFQQAKNKKLMLDMHNALNNLNNQLDSVLSQYNKQHPDIQQLKVEIQNLAKHLQQQSLIINHNIQLNINSFIKQLNDFADS